MENSEVKKLVEFLEDLLKLMGVKASVNAEKDEDGVVHLTVTTETPALLIGYHGKTINALQTIIGVVVYKNLGESSRVVVDVDGWREKREGQLVNLAKTIAERVRATGKSEPMYNLTNFERRVVHLALSEEQDVMTESVGEGRDRYLIIKVKSEKSKIKNSEQTNK